MILTKIKDRKKRANTFSHKNNALLKCLYYIVTIGKEMLSGWFRHHRITSNILSTFAKNGSVYIILPRIGMLLITLTNTNTLLATLLKMKAMFMKMLSKIILWIFFFENLLLGLVKYIFFIFKVVFLDIFIYRISNIFWN